MPNLNFIIRFGARCVGRGAHEISLVFNSSKRGFLLAHNTRAHKIVIEIKLFRLLYVTLGVFNFNHHKMRHHVNARRTLRYAQTLSLSPRPVWNFLKKLKISHSMWNLHDGTLNGKNEDYFKASGALKPLFNFLS